MSNKLDYNLDQLLKNQIWSKGKKVVGFVEGIRKFHVTTAWVVNVGGLYSDMIAQMLGDEESFPILKYSRGCYFKLSSRWRGQFRHLVCPLPDEKHGSLGIHLSFDQTHGVKR